MAVLIRPVTFLWTADGRMAPMPRFKKLCDQQFVVGEEYPLTILEARSRRTHNHFFATVHEAWKNLPEDIATDFPSAEHLRKWALCKTGWSTMKTFPCETHDHARNLAIFARSADEFAVIEVRGNIVRIHQAKSQYQKDHSAQLSCRRRRKEKAGCRCGEADDADQRQEKRRPRGRLP